MKVNLNWFGSRTVDALLKPLGLWALLLLLFTNVALGAELDDKKISVNLKNATLKEAISEIMKSSAYGISYSVDEVDKIHDVTLQMENVTVEEALSSCLSKYGMKYTISNNTVVISAVKQNPVRGGKVRGVVVDGKENVPLIGVNVAVVQGGKVVTGVTTNLDGEFELDVPQGAGLRFTYVGYKEITMQPDIRKKMEIVMWEDANAMEEVVVNGYISRKTEGFAGAVTMIKKEDLQKVHTGNIFTTLSALDAGFRINENNNAGSSPNALPDFTIRGKGSFQDGSTTPLFILDGFEVSVETVYDMDINRIESITLLKDASATILYGSRAANGVVVIETVAPKAGKIRVSYDFKPTIAFVDLSDYDLMNAAEKLEYERLAGVYDPTGDLGSDYTKQRNYYTRYKNVKEGVDTYWLKQPVRDAFSQAHSLYIDGGAEEMRYGIDAMYNQTNGVMKESGRDRYGLGFKLVYRIKDKITLQNYASYSYTHAYNSPYGSFSQYAKLNPYERIHDEKGEVLPTLLTGLPNPLYDAQLPNRDFTNSESFTEQLNIDWNIMEGLRLRGQFSFTKGNSEGETYVSPFSSQYMYDSNGRISVTPVEKRGSLSVSNGKSMNLTGNMTLNYNKMLADKHLLYVSVGGEMSQSKNESRGFSATGFADDRYSDPAFAIQYKEDSKPRSSESLSRSAGFFANVNYIYDNRFFADLSGRYDGSSQFGSNKKWAPFWSAGAGWNVHNEHFWSKNSVLNLLKIRFSYGLTGNQEFSVYQAKTMYNYNTDRLYNTLITSTLMGYGNPNLKWQTQYQTNVGFDLGLWKNRLKVVFNYYHKLTDGMLTNVTVAPSIGLSGNAFTSNLGEIENKGYEVTVNGAIIQDTKNDMEWRLWVQASNNKNVLKKISNQMKGINAANNLEKFIPGAVYEEGQSMTAIKAVQSLGIDPATGQEIFVKKNGTLTYEWNADGKVLCGDEEPTLYGNIGTNIYWKGWNLNAIFKYSVGGDVYNETLALRVEGADPSYNADRRVLNDRWKNPGDHALYKNIRDYNTNYISSRFIQRENYIRFTSVSLSYDFPRSILSEWRLSALRLSFYANDLFNVSTIKEERGLDYPFERSYVFGLTIGL